MIRSIKNFLLFSLITLFFLLPLAIYFLQARLIYIPEYPPGSRKVVWTPDKFGFKDWEEVWLEDEEVRLHCYWIKAQEREEFVLLFLHVKSFFSLRPMQGTWDIDCRWQGD